ncbi:nickel pincer cofactor biosynthesis protein LarB [Natronomonas sp. CBA1123]|uniref:nickel pincer cofactor biosynthesis protein LarB n=1 Tax=Natronomonas sp. CBA1123 TaxID=2668070 RepID=UPI0012E9F479|nr:nickel pincer cofactor biosynthesis protein LarB [Natronomonas sp. CBA1123]MUV87309.1 nickel pincer cofactor biosynthesis protein LarB [Natronomonas sp. CBA1123]
MRDILDAVADGDLSPAEAQAELSGYARTEAGRFDAARESRTGIPEAILAAGKTPQETASMAATAVETTGAALVTRADDDAVDACKTRLADEVPDADIERDARARTLVVHASDYDAPDLDATVTVVTAGTSDAAAAGEAAVVAEEMGATVEFVDDVGVAGIARLFDRLEELRAADVLIVAAGREGALPTVAAGLVDVPLIGLPVSTGYGHGGRGEAALAGMLQSCTPITVVNVDAGFTAGSQAGLIARTVSSARSES